jgi:hypothetical protein
LLIFKIRHRADEAFDRPSQGQPGGFFAATAATTIILDPKIAVPQSLPAFALRLKHLNLSVRQVLPPLRDEQIE